MSLPVGSQLDLMKIPVLGLVAEASASGSPPASPVAGQFWYDTTNNLTKYYNGSAWTTIATSPQATSGALRFRDLSDAAASVATAASGTVLRFNGTQWAAAALAESDIANLTLDLGGKASKFINLTAGTGLTGGGDLSADRTFTVTYGFAAGTALQGNSRLDQIAAPTASVSLNSQRITNLLDPSGTQDAATKGYVDATAQGLDVKASVRVLHDPTVVSGYNATGGTSGRGQITTAPATVDGVSLAVGDRILYQKVVGVGKSPVADPANGIYTVTTVGTGATGVWDRATDFDSNAEVTSGAFTFVAEGTSYDNTGWVLATPDPIVIGGASGTSIVFAQFSGAGQIIAGAGLTKSGNTLDVIGTADRITVYTDSIDIADTYAGQATITTVGTITTGTWSASTVALNKGGTGGTTATAARANLVTPTFYDALLGAMTAGVALTITHNLNSQRLDAEFIRVSDGARVLLAWATTGVNTITVTADIAFAANALAVYITAKG